MGPGQAYTPFMTMEYLLDKLKLLNYETEIVVKMRMRPLNRCVCFIPSPMREQSTLFGDVLLGRHSFKKIMSVWKWSKGVWGGGEGSLTQIPLWREG